jgi:glycerophosphoryl diester phosphodiesterase
MLNLHREALGFYFRARWEIARFSLMFRLFEAIVFAPLATVAGNLLSGRTVVDSTDLVGFVLSPRGACASFVWVTLLLAIRLIEQTGLSAIALGSIAGRPVSAPAALRIVAGRLPRLLVVAAWILLAGLTIVAPLFAVAGWFARSLLKAHDINFYLAERPPAFLTAAGVVGAIAVPTACALVWLAVRWRLVVPALLCEPGGPRELLRSSARLVRGNWRRTAAAWLVTELLILALGLLAAWLARLCSFAAAKFAGDDESTHLGLFAGLLVLRTVLTSFVTLPGPCLAAGVFAMLYRDFRRASEPNWVPQLAAAAGGGPESSLVIAGRRMLAWLPAIVLAAGIVNTVVGMGELYTDRPVAVTAHRGGTAHAIENTVAAVEEAIAVGAQFAEIDVQMSRDGVLVVTHDSDFSRQAGVARRVWEMTYDEIREVPLAREKSVVPADHAPTFDDILDAARGRIRLNIELKYYGDNQPRLAERVVDAVRSRGMIDQVVIQSLHFAGLEEARRAAPEIPIGYLFSLNARQPKRLDVDFLSVQSGRVNGLFVGAAHQRGQEVHVWTVDKAAEMERLINLGVDNLITNRPAEALEVARAYNDLTPPERALRRLRSLLSE